MEAVPRVFRVTGIPLTTTVHELGTALSSEFSDPEIRVDTSQTTINPSCYDKRTQTALIHFRPYSPHILGSLLNNDTYQIQLGDTGHDISIDKDFYGLTQLYATTGEIKTDIVAVCGLNGHAYGSWAGSLNQRDHRKMWLRHFLREDLSQCRTMIYGYNMKVTHNLVRSTLDSTDAFLDELKKARRSEEEKCRPIVFIGHSFGCIIIAQSIIKAKEDAIIHGSLFSKTCATIFFGIPHYGHVLGDMLSMPGEGLPRETLVKSITRGFEELKNELRRFIDYSTTADLKIVSFRETRRLEQGSDGTGSRSGGFSMPVDTGPPVLQLPDTIGKLYAIEGDHSTMIKIGNNYHPQYIIIIRHLMNFTSDFEIEKHFTRAYNAVMDKSAHGLERILQNSTVAVNKDQMHKKNTTTLLHMAIDNGDEATVSVLLAHGADAEEADVKGNTALHLASLGGHEKVVEVLLKDGADIAVTTTDENGFTALHLAADRGHEKAMKVLLENGSDITAIDNAGNTALHIAAQGGYEKMVEALLDCGANIAAADKAGNTALHLAARRRHGNVVEILLKKKAGIEVTGGNRLHFAPLLVEKEPARITDPYKLQTIFDGDGVIHTTYEPDPIESERKIEVKRRWTWKRDIGKGTFGTVYLEEEEGGNRRAVKTLARTSTRVNYFRELSILAKVADHQDLFVKFLGWYENRDSVFIAMEYMHHGDLSNYLSNPDIKRDVKEITRQILKGLVVLHERRICHRDLKPQNILVASIEPIQIKIADFGIAKVEENTYLHTSCGTLGYLAPEVVDYLRAEMPREFVKKGKNYTNAVDIWALGCLLHKILTSETPFLQAISGTDLIDSMSGVVHQLPSREVDFGLLTDFCKGNKDLPTDLLSKCSVDDETVAFLKRLLVANPKSRISAAEALGSPWLLRNSDPGSQVQIVEQKDDNKAPQV